MAVMSGGPVEDTGDNGRVPIGEDPLPTQWLDFQESAPPSRGWSARTISLVLTFAVVAIACTGVTGYSVLRVFGGPTPGAADQPAFGGATDQPALGGDVSSRPPAGPSSAAAARDGSKASSYPVRTVDDLTRVCDRWYYPQSPAYTAPAPHPITISMNNRMDLPGRVTKSFYGQPPGGTPAARAAWEPGDPAGVQLVTCLDLIDTGQAITTCRFDDPKPDTIPMSEGVYQLSVYEVATRRKVTELRMTGEDEQCPSIVLMGSTRMIYSEVNDRQLVDALTRYVEQ
jgi:hypothetical protein